MRGLSSAHSKYTHAAAPSGCSCRSLGLVQLQVNSSQQEAAAWRATAHLRPNKYVRHREAMTSCDNIPAGRVAWMSITSLRCTEPPSSSKPAQPECMHEAHLYCILGGRGLYLCLCPLYKLLKADEPAHARSGPCRDTPYCCPGWQACQQADMQQNTVYWHLSLTHAVCTAAVCRPHLGQSCSHQMLMMIKQKSIYSRLTRLHSYQEV